MKKSIWHPKPEDVDERLRCWIDGWYAIEQWKNNTVWIPDVFPIHYFEYFPTNNKTDSEMQLILAVGWENYDWEMVMIGLTGGIEPHFGKNVWSYQGTLHAWNPTKKPIDRYEQEIEDIFNQAAKTLDLKERKRLYGRWQHIVSDNLPFIYTVQPYSIFAVRNKFGNSYPTVHGGAFSEIEHIYIKEDSD